MIERYKAIEKVLEYVGDSDLVISTTGMISREVFTIQDRPGNLYMIGSMGLASSLGLGVSLMCPTARVFVIEGDGSALMSLGTLPLIATEAPPNLIHVVLDNEAYESTGGQPTISSNVSLAAIGEAAGYPHVAAVENIEALDGALRDGEAMDGPRLIVVKASIVERDGIPRVTHTPEEIRDRFKSQADRHSGG
jgi:thiamine pyrophosphate-dependent acetolactate synthase large subunit-like protein